MPISKYRIVEPTIAMSEDGGRGVAYTMHAGALVELQDGPPDGNKLVEVKWEGKTVLMFTQDLRQRAEPSEDDQ
ncbi:MAG TPA: hypothetical protein VHA14_12640 [Bryobacteraceae bacterium]|nr:hypothetical protein [Bryobacteraceae bacterium]